MMKLRDQYKRTYASGLESLAFLDNLVDWCYSRNHKVAKDIYKHSFVKHIWQDSFFKEFNYINIDNVSLDQITLSTKEILEIEISGFAERSPKNDWYAAGCFTDYYELNFDKGTFAYPLIVVSIGKNYKLFDGNNRLDYFISLQHYHPELVEKTHTVFLLQPKN
jgi:hypothetical protein